MNEPSASIIVSRSSSSTPSNRQESHRIYLQVFGPHSVGTGHAATQTTSAAGVPFLHRHNSHDIHPPNYPMTAPGAPYRFASSSDSSVSSYAFSSTASHRLTSQHRPRLTGYPSTSTTSAAVRLTDRAMARDVTALLRGKFGLPPISSRKDSETVQSTVDRDKLPTRLSHYHKRATSKHSRSNSSYNIPPPTVQLDNEVDVLVLVGTIERPPRGYIRFEHEEYLEEQSRLEAFRHLKFSHSRANPTNGNYHSKLGEMDVSTKERLPVSLSADTIKASGAEQGWTSSMAITSSISALNRGLEGSSVTFLKSSGGFGSSFSSEEDLRLDDSGGIGVGSSTVGLDLSTSRGSTVFTDGDGGVSAIPLEYMCGGEPHDSGRRMEKTRPIVSASYSHSRSPVKQNHTPLEYWYDLEPIHVIRTVHPDEHPLKVRDKMMEFLFQMRHEAEDEMGLRLHPNEGKEECLMGQQLPQPAFRWFFQPCSALGECGASMNSPKIQSIPSYVDLEGYCTGWEDSSDSDSDNSDNGLFSSDSLDESHTYSNDLNNSIEKDMIRRFSKERHYIGMIRDFTDPAFTVSGYLLYQSRKDPNVWRRVYCILAEDRLWIVNRMKPLRKHIMPRKDFVGNDDIYSSLRVGRHTYIKYHQSLLLEGGDDFLELKDNGRYLSPLGRRLPNTFRILDSHGIFHSFRAFDASSFRVWVVAFADKITQKHCDGLMDLASLIAQEETLARSKRLDDVALSPIWKYINAIPESVSPLTSEIIRIVAQFGMSVADYRELCRHVGNAIQPHKNEGMVLNLQTKVGSRDQKTRSLIQGQQFFPTSQKVKHYEYVGMVSSVWEDARIVASKSAQLLHAITAVQQKIHEKYDITLSDTHQQREISAMMINLIKEQKEMQVKLGKQWDSVCNALNNARDTSIVVISAEMDLLSLPPLQLFDLLLKLFQSVCTAIYNSNNGSST